MNDQAKHLVDATAITGAIFTVIGWLPAVAAFLSIVWTVIRIYETKTVQKLIAGHKAKKAWKVQKAQKEQSDQ